MPDIQLTYFDLRARAEPARLLLAYGGVSYEDERIATPWDDRAGWLAKKSSFAWGQVPRLTWDGKIIYTALAIARFLAREFGLMGKNNLESGQVDEVVDVIQDTLQAGYKTFWMPDEEKKKALEKHNKETIPNFLKMAEKRLTERGGQFMVGNVLTWADIQLYFFCSENPGHLGSLPKIADLVKRVGDLPNIKRWVENRPKTAF